ncbi:hypothetical protein SDC9_189523 [bioreactor metagenome]|uniref:Uncharacterized protein n=1 Tax=bioreactor metagenome TaxID=1076179 RepID=A0A645HSE5_9ZZZZ
MGTERVFVELGQILEVDWNFKESVNRTAAQLQRGNSGGRDGYNVLRRAIATDELADQRGFAAAGFSGQKDIPPGFQQLHRFLLFVRKLHSISSR